MLRKLILLAITAGLAKRAWDQYQAGQPATAGTEPLATPEPDIAGSAVVPPIAPESPLAWH
jgi:hypothetical protein